MKGRLGFGLYIQIRGCCLTFRMRLTLELLQQAPQSLNPALHRQLLLRGFKWLGSTWCFICSLHADCFISCFLRIPTIATWLSG